MYKTTVRLLYQRRQTLTLKLGYAKIYTSIIHDAFQVL
jgi:hypothetical protein